MDGSLDTRYFPRRGTYSLHCLADRPGLLALAAGGLGGAKFSGEILMIQRVCLLLVLVFAGQVMATEPWPTMRVSDLPPELHDRWLSYKPDLGTVGRCAAAYDGYDRESTVFTCSIYVKISAVAARKAMDRCEQMRAERKIAAPCRIITER